VRLARQDPQLNIRLKPELRAVLDAAAFVHGHGTAGKLVQDIVEEAIGRYADEATVQKALDAKKEQAALDEGKLARLPVRDATSDAE
jgi:uncharacterized protein (DUF1778 family)